MAALSGIALAAWARAADLPIVTTEKGFPIVEIAINGEGPFPMVLDTGAGLTTVTTPLKDRLGLLNIGRMPEPIQLAGGAEPIDMYTMGFVNLAGEPAPSPITVVLDAPLRYVRQAQGILGMNVLSRFAIDLDQPNRRLIVRPLGAVPESGPWTALKVLKRADNFLIVEAMVDGVKAKALIDTGANETILNAKLAAQVGLVEGAPGVTPGKLALVDGHSLKGHVKSVALGNAAWDGLDVQAADLPLFAALELGDGPALVLGNDALKQIRLFIDYSGSQIFVTPPPASAMIGEGDGGEVGPAPPKPPTLER